LGLLHNAAHLIKKQLNKLVGISLSLLEKVSLSFLKQFPWRFVMKVHHLFLAAFAAVFLFDSNIGHAQEKFDAAMESIAVTVASDGEKTGRLDFRLAELEFFKNNEALEKQKIPQQWQTALLESINKMGVFQSNATMKVDLSVKILKLEIDPTGFPNKTATVEAHYEITDQKTGDLIFTQNLKTTGVVNISYSINSLLCVRESVNRAVQNNIAQFLEALKTVDVKTPMFQAVALTKEVRQQVYVDLQGKCYTAFLHTATNEQGMDAYQSASSAILKDSVFAIGMNTSQQYCGWARKVGTWEDAEKKAIATCDAAKPQGGSACEVYARNNHIVYVSIQERLKSAKKLFEAGDSPATENVLNEMKVRNLSALTTMEMGEYEYLFGKVLLNSNADKNRTEAIGYFNNAWSKYKNLNGAIEEGNAQISIGNIANNWQSIRNAYQYFLANASDEQKSLHPEAKQNLKQAESYYQADLAQREKQAKADATKVKREAKQQEQIRQAEIKRIAKEGDGSADDITCKSYGAKPSSDRYINCRIQLSRTKQLADEQQAAQTRLANEQRASQQAAQIRAENERRAVEVARQEEQVRREAADETKRQFDFLGEALKSYNNDQERRREESNRSSISVMPTLNTTCRNDGFGNIHCTTN
jgi:hypothetical protein